MENKYVPDKWNCNLYYSVAAMSILQAVSKISNFEEYATFLACPLHFNVFKNKLENHQPWPLLKARKSPSTVLLLYVVPSTRSNLHLLFSFRDS